LNGWVAHVITRNAVTWQKMGHAMEWQRVEQSMPATKGSSKVQAPSAVEKAVAESSASSPLKKLNGIWKSSDGSLCTALEGECVIGETRSDIAVVEGMLCLNGWKAAHIDNATVKWQKQGKLMEWQRIQQVSDIDLLKGFWKNTDGLACFVHNEECSFISRGRTSELLMADGMLSLNGWVATGITPRVASWKKGQQSMLWHRVEHAKELEVLNGAWRASDGSTCNVSEGVCAYTSKGKASVVLALQEGSVRLQDWSATSISPTLIQWHNSGQTMEWRKDNQGSQQSTTSPSKTGKGENGSAAATSTAPAAQFSNAPPAAESPPTQSRGLTGMWRNTDGLTCTVAGETCTFVTKGACAIESRDGEHVLNGWKAAEITANTVKWERSGRAMEWTRIQKPGDVEELVGKWKNTDGLSCDVVGGACTFEGRPSVDFTMQTGLVTLNGWSAVAITPTSVTWQKLGRTMEWHRIQ